MSLPLASVERPMAVLPARCSFGPTPSFADPAFASSPQATFAGKPPSAPAGLGPCPPFAQATAHAAFGVYTATAIASVKPRVTRGAVALGFVVGVLASMDSSRSRSRSRPKRAGLLLGDTSGVI